MNEMEKYLYNHGYVSETKKSNRQSELSIERAECIANKYNSLVEEKDRKIERLNNIINKFEEWLYGEKMTFYRGYNDESYLIAFGDVYSKWKELKGELNKKG